MRSRSLTVLPFTKKYSSGAEPLPGSGIITQPVSSVPPLSSETLSASSAKVPPMTDPTLMMSSSGDPGILTVFTSLPSRLRVISKSDLESARWETVCRMRENSVFSLLRKRLLAGTLKKRSFTSTVVPTGCEAGLMTASCSLPSAKTCQASFCPSVLEVSVSLETAAAEASASPRKPMVVMEPRSSDVLIFEVAWRRSASGRSSRGMPEPLSRTRMSLAPPWTMSTSIFVAPASSEFSTSSFTTDAGRSTTSPAAI